MKGILATLAKVSFLMVALTAILFSAAQLQHKREFGHYMNFGWHIDLLRIPKSENPELGQLIALKVTNVMSRTEKFEVIPDRRFGGLGCGGGYIYAEEVRRLSEQNTWEVLGDPEKAITSPTAGVDVLRIWPLQSACAGWFPMEQFENVQPGGTFSIRLKKHFSDADSQQFFDSPNLKTD